ncbi:MAG TPA: diacylglycerol kinase family protein [Actinocrinis sp.]|nr:diacylglycerol kinase family protein [Actinocrinis sp.]
MTRIALVVNPTKADPAQIEALHRTVAAACAAAALPPPRLLLTSEQDAGGEQARRALADGADLVAACGGDGTVNAVAQALAGTGAVLGIVPLGTGNLLAANLGVPKGIDDAVSALITGRDRRIDLGRCGRDRILVGLAGLGLDAAMVADVPAFLKKRIGWPAYVVSIARHLPDRGVTVVFELDGRRVRHFGVRTVLIGNFGRVQGGINLLPAAAPDDGLLDVVVLAPRGRLLGWLGVLAHLHRTRPDAPARTQSQDSDAVHRYRAKRVVAHTRHPVAHETDGEFLGRGTRLAVEVQPLALTVRVPQAPAAPVFPDPAAAIEASRGGAR